MNVFKVMYLSYIGLTFVVINRSFLVTLPSLIFSHSFPDIFFVTIKKSRINMSISEILLPQQLLLPHNIIPLFFYLPETLQFFVVYFLHYIYQIFLGRIMYAQGIFRYTQDGNFISWFNHVLFWHKKRLLICKLYFSIY